MAVAVSGREPRHLGTGAAGASRLDVGPGIIIRKGIIGSQSDMGKTKSRAVWKLWRLRLKTFILALAVRLSSSRTAQLDLQTQSVSRIFLVECFCMKQSVQKLVFHCLQNSADVHIIQVLPYIYIHIYIYI